MVIMDKDCYDEKSQVIKPGFKISVIVIGNYQNDADSVATNLSSANALPDWSVSQ